MRFPKLPHIYYKVDARSCQLVRLARPVRLLPRPLNPSAPDWKLIDWRFRFVQHRFLPAFGIYPDVAVNRGILKVVRFWRAGGIDLIHADNSVKNLGGDSSSVSVEGGKKEKLEKAARRLANLHSCGKVGHIAFEKKLGEEQLRPKYYPHRCHSIFCPYCARENFKETFGRLLPHLETLAQNGQLNFLTLTLKNFPVSSYEDVAVCIDTAFKAIERLKDFRLFGKRNWKRVMSAVEKELEDYYKKTKERYGEEEARKRVARHRFYIEEFIDRHRELIGDSSFRFYQLGNWVVKFELTYNAERKELHPHWHIITDVRLPKLLITAVWKLLTGSQIVDIRAVDSTKDATAELSKYITKGWEFKEGTEELKLWIEAVMHGRRKFRVWGFEMLELAKEEKQKQVVVAWWLKTELVHRKNLHDVPRLARRMRKKGIKEAVIDEVLVYDNLTGIVWRAELVLTAEEELFIRGSPSFHEAMEHHFELALVEGRPASSPEVEDDYELEL